MSTVQVQFFTKESKYAIPETSLLLPVNLKRKGLTEVVHHFLDEDCRIPLEFLLDGVIIRGSLEEVLASTGRSCEDSLNVEYICALQKPKNTKALTHNDWVSCFASVDSFTVSGDFSGSVYLWDSKLNLVHSLKISDFPIKCCSSFVKMEESYIVFGGIDQTIHLLLLDKRCAKLEKVGESKGHLDSVLSLSSSDSLVISSSHNGEILSWSFDESDPVRLNHVSSFNGHNMAVNCVKMFQNDDETFVSGGLDRLLCLHNIQVGSIVSSFTSDAAFIDLSIGQSNLVYSCHSDQYIRVWDPRNENSKCQKISTRSMFNSCVSASPLNPNHILCGSFDGSVKVYDTRSSELPVFTLRKEIPESKVFCCEYKSDASMLFGGEDCKLSLSL